MNLVNFLPFVGEHYWNSRYGKRVLVLGESHYSHEPPTGIPENFTRNVIQEWGKDKRHRFFTKISNILLLRPGGYLEMDERAGVWDHVVFYNFVQQIVGTGPRERPSKEMWQYATEPFLSVLDDLQPEVVIVLGKQLSLELPEMAQQIRIVRTNHPSSSHFKYAQVISDFRDALHRYWSSLLQPSLKGSI